MTLEEIKQKIDSGALDCGAAIEELTCYIGVHPSEDEAYTLRGLRYWSNGERALAINDYLAAIRINPQSRAVMVLKATYEILDFYNKDLYNP